MTEDTEVSGRSETINQQSNRVNDTERAVLAEDDNRGSSLSGNSNENNSKRGINDPHNISYGKPENMSLPREFAFLLVIVSAQLLTQCGVGQGLATLEIVGDHFGDTDPGVKSWYIAGYSLTVGTFILSAGRLGDIFGHKLMFVGGFSWFCVWSLLCGISSYVKHSSIFFSVCRGLQGTGPAVLMPNALALLGRAYHLPGKRKHLAFALFGACAPSGFVLGALFSSLLSQFATWQWSFYIMAIACLAVSILSILVIPADEGFDKEYRDSQHFDYIGAFFGISGLVLVNCAWNQSPIVGWKEPYVYVLLILGALCLVTFFWVELKVAKHPLIPLPAFNAVLGRTLASVACGWSTFGIWVFFAWRFWQVLRGQSSLAATAQSSPAAVSGFAASVFTGFAVGRIPTSAIMLGAMVFFCISCILLAPMPIVQTYWSLSFVSMVLAPWGMDMSFPAATIMLSSAVPKEHQGIAASLVATVVNYSISMGLGMAGTVQRYTVPEGVTDENDKGIVLKSYRSAFYLGIGLSGLGTLIACYSFASDIFWGKKKNIQTPPTDEEKAANESAETTE